ncbi:hypothetical protein J3R30DRAFT_1755702 [Lentinula aciculospora]|uniref:Uncharacterized protein n=1 Tax=Lentinula aciculospora TaxID=153920 RepID=A0A9W9AI51_9AGAR|nr:hypothetical protein J3R30DRAFT_1755702 [Lentinula aciculospora]
MIKDEPWPAIVEVGKLRVVSHAVDVIRLSHVHCGSFENAMDIPQTPGKRKRETNAPRITYHAASRTFDRLFKEESLDETKDVVRRKLGLPESSSIYLAQIRGEHTVDLEDEDDFDAFYAIAHSNMAVEVQVTTEENRP